MKLTIHWFRQDLRLADNPSLTEAARKGTVLPVYILDDVNAGDHKIGGANRWWLHHSLSSLNASLDGQLAIFAGDPQMILPGLVERSGATGVSWNRCYEPWRIERDTAIKENLKAAGIEVSSYNGSLLWEPWEPLKKDGTPYRVFTPFYRRGCLSQPPPREPLPKPSNLNLVSDEHSIGVDGLNLLPKIRWDKQLEPHWEIGEAGAHKRMMAFVEGGINGYKDGRNFPSQQNVSRLSAYLQTGEISPNIVWYKAKEYGSGNDLDTFHSELGWREFSYSLLYHFPTLPWKNLQSKFDRFPWGDNSDFLERWQTGQTGYPIVDAGMRELWQTGYIHNRVRMIVGSFLVKNLLLDWRHGERWFWDCLVDADLANNSAGWQWIGGTGADAAPYFRIFNPITQGQKFDKEGEYTRHFVPELKNVPKKYLYNPWDAPPIVLRQAGVVLGETYPHPVVNVKESRELALEAFASLKRT